MADELSASVGVVCSFRCWTERVEWRATAAGLGDGVGTGWWDSSLMRRAMAASRTFAPENIPIDISRRPPCQLPSLRSLP